MHLSKILFTGLIVANLTALNADGFCFEKDCLSKKVNKEDKTLSYLKKIEEKINKISGKINKENKIYVVKNNYINNPQKIKTPSKYFYKNNLEEIAVNSNNIKKINGIDYVIVDYTIKPGDIPQRIANRFNSSVKLIREINKLKGRPGHYIIYAGKTIKVPAKVFIKQTNLDNLEKKHTSNKPKEDNINIIDKKGEMILNSVKKSDQIIILNKDTYKEAAESINSLYKEKNKSFLLEKNKLLSKISEQKNKIDYLLAKNDELESKLADLQKKYKKQVEANVLLLNNSYKATSHATHNDDEKIKKIIAAALKFQKDNYMFGLQEAINKNKDFVNNYLNGE